VNDCPRLECLSEAAPGMSPIMRVRVLTLKLQNDDGDPRRMDVSTAGCAR
jgi:hypothetical protein